MTWTLALVLWYVVLVVLLTQLWFGRTPLAGLTICYWLNLASHHLVSETLCILHVNRSEYRWAADVGFPITGYAMLGLLVGGAIMPQLFFRLPKIPAFRSTALEQAGASVSGAALAIPVGMAIFLFGRLIPQIPSLNAVLFGGNMLAGTGFAWLVVRYYRTSRYATAGWVMLSALTLPILTMVIQGFFGFGVMSLLVIVSVVMATIRTQAKTLLKWAIISIPVVYLVFSVLITYMGGRDAIRQSVWYRGESLGQRLSISGEVFTDRWQWFNPWDENQRMVHDARFNQNYYVGMNKSFIDGGGIDYLNGSTLINGLIAMVPRAIWPGKPVVAGGSDQMAMITGLRFASGVTFGVGHVLELHANYGRGGVFAGFIGFGLAIAFIDRRAGKHLAAGRFREFVLWFVPGTALINGALGRFTETTTSFLGFWALAAGFGWLVSAMYPAPRRPQIDPVVLRV